MKRAIQRIFEQFGDEFVKANRGQLTKQHLKTIHHIRACGTPGAGWIAFECGGRLVAVGILDSRGRSVLAFNGRHPKRE